MKKMMTTLLCGIAMTMAAQEQTNDTTIQMKEVVVETSTVRDKLDRKLYLPTGIQRKMSNNGVTLLQAMQLPRIDVNPVNNTITTSGGESVQLRINGVEASTQELIALQPKDIIRIEYHTMPGLRYGNAAAVLDYIVRHRETGGDLSANLVNGITMTGLTDGNIAGKLYSGKSAFSVMGDLSRRDLKWIRENYETFRFADREISTREIGYPTKVAYTFANLQLGYSYTNADKSLLNITFRDRANHQPAEYSDRHSKVFIEDASYEVNDHQRSRQNSPSLDIYYQLKLPKGQQLYFDVVGTYIDSWNERTFTQSSINSITSQTDGSKYSLIGEAIYERMFKSAKLTAGIKHTQSYTHNSYTTMTDTKTAVALRYAETYAFAELQQQLGRFGYTAGIGMMRTYNRQGSEQQEKYIPRPSVTLTYNATKNLYLRYQTYISAYSPSLASLSNVTQGIDTYQLRRGNPNLKPASFWANNLTVSWQSKPVNIDIYTRYSYDRHPIMDETLLEDNMIVRTEDNHRGFHRLNIDASFRIRPLCNLQSDFARSFSISLTPFFNRYISHGNSYTHTHSNTGLRGGAMAMWKHWMAMVEMKTSQHTLWGEKLTYGEATHMAIVGYNKEHWSVRLMMINPFVKHYTQEQRDLSAAGPCRQLAYSNNVSRTLMLNVSLNLSFGKQQRNADKRINNDDTDAGILSGTKK
jgi:hypothetical protein